MSEVDKDLSERYRAGAREEPPEQIDAAILAAAKRAVASQPRLSGQPRSLRRWYVPVSLAAVIMLSVVVTLRIEREQPELALPDAAPVAREKEQKPVQKASEPRAAAPAPQASAEAASGRIAENTADRSIASGARREARAMSAPAGAAPQVALAKRELAPEEWLERIADLRTQGRDADADEQFAEFKRHYPEFKIPEPMMERIAPRK